MRTPPRSVHHRRVRWLVAVVLLTSHLAFAQPTLDDSIAHAAAANKPLVVELYAEWCGPCHEFEAQVLPRADVKRALGTVDFVRYDIDQPAGEAIAQQFNSTSVPTFLVLDSSGREIMRQVGLGTSASPEKWFLDLITAASKRRNMAGTLEGLVRIHPDDAAARMALARYYLANHRADAAREQLAVLVDSPNRAVAAEAFAGVKLLDLAKARVDAALDAALEVVSRFPDAEQSSMALVLLAASKHVDRAHMHALVEKHLQTVPDEALPSAVRVAVLTGHVPLAREQIVERRGRPVTPLVEAELNLYAGGQLSIPPVCREPGFEFDCLLLEDAVSSQSHFTAATRYMAKQAKRQLELLELLEAASDDYPDIGQLVEQPIAFRNALAANLRNARQQCAPKSPARRVWVRIAFGAGRVTTDVRGPDTAAACVRDLLDHAPEVTSPGDLDAEIYVPLQLGSRRLVRLDDGASHERGVFAGFAMDIGNEVYTIAAHGQHALSDRRLVHLLVAGDLEVGASADGFAYAGRAYLGYSVVLRPWLSFLGSGGLGVRDFGDEILSRAFTVPAELRLRLWARGEQYHLWVRDALVLGTDNMMSSNEWAAGIGATNRKLTGSPLYLQASVENRAHGYAAVFTLGAAFGLF